MMKNDNKKKGNPTKKILPAAGMLALSASMLATSTYAWFTMSREVEVTGLKMTATVPEDLQISLGKLALANAPATAAQEKDNIALVNSTGTLYAASAGAASNLGAATPENAWDWSNSADISAYYAFGRLMPASSTTGEKIFYTPDASGVGKTVKANASYFQANDALFARPTNSVATASSDTTGATSARATLHAFTAKSGSSVDDTSDTWTKATAADDYTQAVDWKNTKDDGYYIDIPIWLRTSSNAAINLAVEGYVLPGDSWVNGTATKKQTDLELYRAVRVALLDGENVTADVSTGAVDAVAGAPAAGLKVDTTANVANIIPLRDAWVKDATDTTSTVAATLANVDTTAFSSIIAANMPYATTLNSILDSLNYKRVATTMQNTDLYAVSGSDTSLTTFATGDDYYAGTYSSYTAYDKTASTNSANQIATVAGSTTGGEYGAAKKLIIRVWLDGEDQECWNDNAGQDWAISLKFSKIEASS
jgi:hypothetical protein